MTRGEARHDTWPRADSESRANSFLGGNEIVTLPPLLARAPYSARAPGNVIRRSGVRCRDVAVHDAETFWPFSSG